MYRITKKPSRDDRYISQCSRWQEELYAALSGFLLSEQPIEKMLDHMERAQ